YDRSGRRSGGCSRTRSYSASSRSTFGKRFRDPRDAALSATPFPAPPPASSRSFRTSAHSRSCSSRPHPPGRSPLALRRSPCETALRCPAAPFLLANACRCPDRGQHAADVSADVQRDGIQFHVNESSVLASPARNGVQQAVL